MGEESFLGEDNDILMLHVLSDQMGSDPRDRQFTGRIDIEQDHFIELVEATGELSVEVLCTAIEMGLEDPEDLAVGIELTHGADAGVKLIGVMRIVIDEHTSGVIDEAVEASVDSSEGGYTLTQFIEMSTTEVGHSHRSYGILYIDEQGYT